mgnify:CR=1 FL=1
MFTLLAKKDIIFLKKLRRDIMGSPLISIVTVILFWSASMNGVVLNEGQIITINPGEATDFMAITDVTTVVVKTPGVVNNKYNS